ncbi:MAG: hypothetical protein WB523_22575 [Candidatus Sulfotelmatobacter sp.]
MRKNAAFGTSVGSDAIRSHAYEKYISAARRRKENTVSINVGEVHRALALNNRVPLVCAALGSQKFLTEHGLRIISKTGPPSGQSTTVTFTYEIVSSETQKASAEEAWQSLRGIAKDVFASFGGGEAYLRQERANFYGPGQDPLEAQIMKRKS